jgi:hypothetical protein
MKRIRNFIQQKVFQHTSISAILAIWQLFFAFLVLGKGKLRILPSLGDLDRNFMTVSDKSSRLSASPTLRARAHTELGRKISNNFGNHQIFQPVFSCLFMPTFDDEPCARPFQGRRKHHRHFSLKIAYPPPKTSSPASTEKQPT